MTHPGDLTSSVDEEARALVVDRLSVTDPNLWAVWRGFQDAGCVRSPFLTWQWLDALASEDELASGTYVLVVSNGSRRVGLLPLQWSVWPGRLRVVGFPGARWLSPDHLDVVSAAGEGAAVAAAILGHLAACRDWDYLDLNGLAADGALLEASRRRLRPTAVLPLRAQTVRVPYVTLRSRDERRLFPSSGLRQQLRRGLRAAGRAGGALAVESEPAALENLIDELMRLHIARFGDRSLIFATESRRRFHRAAVCRLAEAGMARIYRLTAGGREAALLYALVLGSTVYYYSMGMDPTASPSPGRTVLGNAIRLAAEEGLDEFDLLRGDHAFKFRFATGVRSDARLRYLNGSAASIARASATVLGSRVLGTSPPR